ncbi:hypothetical protein I3760_09G132200 [Carya illinoinensis]|nr:hypothetical protein I3760_09G132200 [Carya illinoinensis]
MHECNTIANNILVNPKPRHQAKKPLLTPPMIQLLQLGQTGSQTSYRIQCNKIKCNLVLHKDSSQSIPEIRCSTWKEKDRSQGRNQKIWFVGAKSQKKKN